MPNQTLLSMKAGHMSSSVRFEVGSAKPSLCGVVEGITNPINRNFSARFQILWDSAPKIQTIKTNEII